MKRFILGCAILGLLISAPVSAELDIDPMETTAAQLDREQARLNSINIKLDALSQNHAVIKAIRNNYFQGSKGVVTLTLKWYEDVEVWLYKLDRLKGILKNTPDMLNISTKNKFKRLVNDMASDLAKIKNKARDIRGVANNALNELYLTRKFSRNYLKDYSAEIELYNKSRADLIKAVERAKSDIDNVALYEMKKAFHKTRDIAERLIVLNSVEFPELISLRTEVGDFLLVQSSITPLVDELSIISGQMKSHTFKGELTFAEEKLKELSLLSQDYKDRIDDFILPAQTKTSLKKDIDEVQQQAEGYLDNVLDDRASFLVERYAELEYVAWDCEDNWDNARTKINCSLLRALQGLTEDAIWEMSEDDQKFLDRKINEVYAGPAASTAGA